MSEHTKGPVFRDTYGTVRTAKRQEVPVRGFSTPLGRHPQTEEAEANTDLLIEAINVAHETGLTPRQLAEQRKALLAFAVKVRDFARELDDDGLYDAADTAIANAEKEKQS